MKKQVEAKEIPPIESTDGGRIALIGASSPAAVEKRRWKISSIGSTDVSIGAVQQKVLQLAPRRNTPIGSTDTYIGSIDEGHRWSFSSR